MAKVILGMHGLANKPEQQQLYEWWHKSINDGLEKVGHPAIPENQFHLAYWADLMYPAPDQDPEPYTEPETDVPDPDRNKIIAIARDFLGSVVGGIVDAAKKLTQNEKIEEIKNAVRGKVVDDLAQYYDDESTIKFTDEAGQQTRETLRRRLRDLIEQHKDNDLMVIGHSMGSIIAYDVLRGLSDSNIRVSHFVTIGSPLGLSTVKTKTRTEWDGKDGPYVPEIVTKSWLNLGDPKDLVSADLTLNGEYLASTNVDVTDVVVNNGYNYEKSGETKHNHHKSYGYLRTEELGKHTKEFLSA